MKFLILFIAGLSFSLTNDQAFKEIHGDFNYTKEERVEAQWKMERISRQLDNFVDLSDGANRALGSIIRLAAKNLRRRGHHKTARKLEIEWSMIDGRIVEIAKGQRDIGDFEPISEWLALAYEIIELNLGFTTCQILRLTDIKTINFALRVVFNPCRYGLVEFTNHFVGDKYKGLAPVVSYWSVVTGCSIGTFGAGYFFVCSPAGWLIELGVLEVVAPRLSPKLYNLACQT